MSIFYKGKFFTASDNAMEAQTELLKAVGRAIYSSYPERFNT